jgi:hypothetical protein
MRAVDAQPCLPSSPLPAQAPSPPLPSPQDQPALTVASLDTTLAQGRIPGSRTFGLPLQAAAMPDAGEAAAGAAAAAAAAAAELRLGLYGSSQAAHFSGGLSMSV